MTSDKILSKKLENTWNYNLIELLVQSHSGDLNALNNYLNTFEPFTFVNSDSTTLLTLRTFDSKIRDGKISVLNLPPESECFQWGITITKITNSGNVQYNIFLPNDRNYSGIKILRNNLQIFMSDQEPVSTNILQIEKKLRFTDDFTQQELEEAFESISNQIFEKLDDQRLDVKNLLITIPSIGPLIYNEDFEWYEGIFTSDDVAFDINIYNTADEKLSLLLAFVEDQIQAQYYKSKLIEMEPEMIKLKNDFWREKNEITSETEAEITADDFKRRVSIDSIIFNDDCSSHIYCHDDDIFWGHQIKINVDNNGTYKGVELVG